MPGHASVRWPGIAICSTGNCTPESRFQLPSSQFSARHRSAISRAASWGSRVWIQMPVKRAETSSWRRAASARVDGVGGGRRVSRSGAARELQGCFVRESCVGICWGLEARGRRRESEKWESGRLRALRALRAGMSAAAVENGGCPGAASGAGSSVQVQVPTWSCRSPQLREKPFFSRTLAPCGKELRHVREIAARSRCTGVGPLPGSLACGSAVRSHHGVGSETSVPP